MDAKNWTKLSADEVRKKTFNRGLRGFSANEVTDFLENVAKALERVYKSEKDLTDKVQSLSEEVMRWKGREGEIEKLRDQANREATTIKEDAQKDAQKMLVEMEERATSIRSRTEEWLEQVLANVEETERRKSSFVTAFKSALDSHYELLKQEQEEGEEPLSERLSHFLKQGPSTGGSSPSRSN